MKTHNSKGVRLVPRALAVLNDNDYALVVVTRDLWADDTEHFRIGLKADTFTAEEARAVAQAILQLAGEP